MPTYISRDTLTLLELPEEQLYYDDAGENHSSGYLYVLSPSFDLRITLYKDWLANPANIYVYATPFSFRTNTWGEEITIGSQEMSRTDSGSHSHHFVYNWNPSPTTDPVWKRIDDVYVRLWEIRWTCSTAGEKWLRLRVNTIRRSMYVPTGKRIYGISYIGAKHYGDYEQNRNNALRDLNITSRTGSKITSDTSIFCVPAK